MKNLISFENGAYEELASCFNLSRGNAYVRIYIQPLTCTGPVARMMRDYKGPTEKDIVIPFEKFTIIINRSLMEKMEHINMNFNGHIILIESKLKNVSSGCMHCPYGQEGNCNITRKFHKNYATWKMAGLPEGKQHKSAA